MNIRHKLTIVSLAVIFCILPGCGPDPDPVDNGKLAITGVSIPSTINTTKGGTIIISGNEIGRASCRERV